MPIIACIDSCMVIAKDGISMLNALTTALVAIITAYIAWQQYRVNHRSLQNLLYERRYVVFKVFMSYFAEIFRDGRVNSKQLIQFRAESCEADFLFSKLISQKAEELYKNGIELEQCHDTMYPSDGSDGLPVGSERSKASEKEAQLLKWFGEQFEETKGLFKTEMKIV
jgi:hypothetical protein